MLKLLVSVLLVGAHAKLVRDLTPERWKDVVEGKRWLVYFALQGCKHCEQLAPMMERCAELSPDLLIGRVDATKYNGVARTYEVKKFPTILLLDEDGVYYEFIGRRSIPALQSFGRATAGALGGGRFHPGELQPNVSDWWLLAEAMWDPLKIAIKWSVGLALGLKLVALGLLRLLKFMGAKGEVEAEDDDDDDDDDGKVAADTRQKAD